MQRAYAAHLIQCFMMFHAVSCFVDYFVNSSSFLSVRATLDALWFTGRPVPPESSASEAARFGVEIRDDSRWPWIRRMVRCMADGEVFSSTASTKRGFESGWIFNDLSWILTENQNNNNKKKKTKKKNSESRSAQKCHLKTSDKCSLCMFQTKLLLSMLSPKKCSQQPETKKELGWFRQTSSIQKNAKNKNAYFMFAKILNLIRRNGRNGAPRHLPVARRIATPLLLDSARPYRLYRVVSVISDNMWYLKDFETMRQE